MNCLLHADAGNVLSKPIKIINGETCVKMWIAAVTLCFNVVSIEICPEKANWPPGVMLA